MGRHDSHKSRPGSSSNKKRNDKKNREDDDDYEKRRHRKRRDDNYDDDDDDDYGSSSRHKRKRRHDDDEEDDRRHRHHRRNRRSSKHDDDDESDGEYSGRDRKRSKKEKRHHDRHRRHDDGDDDSRRRKSSSSRHHNKPKGKSSSRRRDEDDSSGEEKRHHSRSKDSKRHKKDKKSNKEKKSSSSKKSEDKIKDQAATTTIKPNPPDKSKLYPMSAILGRKPDTLIDPIKDYFTFHEQFWVYLYRNIGIAFNDLTSEESREYFQKFANEYNDGNYLEAEYYLSKMPSEILEECKTTKHSWSFNTRMTDTEKRGLQQLQQNITKQTEYNNKKVGNPKAAVATRAPLPNPSPYCHPAATTAMAPTTNPQNQWKKTPEERLEERRANKRLRDHVRNAEEELDGGPKDLRERQLAKKREKSEKMHGGSRDRMAEPEISDDVLYGGDNTTDNYQAALAKEKARKAKRSQNQANRITELQNKEKERQENMLKMLGMQNLKPGQKITIAPRKDG